MTEFWGEQLPSALPSTKLTNKFHIPLFRRMLLFFCSGLLPVSVRGCAENNLRRLLRTVEALSDLGPEMTAEREFSQTARAMVSALLQAGGAREAVLFTFSDKPSMLSSVASEGFALMPEPRHHAVAAEARSCP